MRDEFKGNHFFTFEVTEGLQQGISTSIPADIELVIGGRDECDICLLDIHLDQPLLVIRIDSAGGVVHFRISEGDGQSGKIDIGETFRYSDVAFRILSTKSSFLGLKETGPEELLQPTLVSPPAITTSFFCLEYRKSFVAALCLSFLLFYFFGGYHSSLFDNQIVDSNSTTETPLHPVLSQENPSKSNVVLLNIELQKRFPRAAIFIDQKDSHLVLKGYLDSSNNYYSLRQFVKTTGLPISFSVKLDSEVKYQIESWRRENHIFPSAMQYRGAGLISVAPFMFAPSFQPLIKDFRATFPDLTEVRMDASDMAMISEDVQRFLASRLDPTTVVFFNDGFFNVKISNSHSSTQSKVETFLRTDILFSLLPYVISINKSSHTSSGKPDLIKASAKSVDTTPSLPFHISSIFGGATPWVYTKENERIQVGGFHRGYRLVHVGDSELTFEGKYRITVPR